LSRAPPLSLAPSTLAGESTSAAVFLFHSDEKRFPEFQYAGEEGKFVFRGLAPDTYRVLAVDNLGAFDPENPVAVSRLSSQMLEISLSATQSITIALEVAQVHE